MSEYSIAEIKGILESFEVPFKVVARSEWAAKRCNVAVGEEYTYYEKGWGGWDRLYQNSLSIQVPELGHVEVIEQQGGEGEGSEYVLVFKVTDSDNVRYFRLDAYYASYEGVDWEDSTFKEVQPIVREVTFYE